MLRVTRRTAGPDSRVAFNGALCANVTAARPSNFASNTATMSKVGATKMAGCTDAAGRLTMTVTAGTADTAGLAVTMVTVGANTAASGGNAAHGKYVHLYLNGLYWGLYNVHERTDDSFAEAYFGGAA